MSPTPGQISVLVADDDNDMRDVIRLQLEHDGLHVVEACSSQEALALMREDIQLAILDVRMPERDGLACLKDIKRRFPETQVIMLSADNTVPVVVQAMKEGAFWYLSKDHDPEEFRSLVRRALLHGNLKRENKQLRDALAVPMVEAQFVGESPLIRDILSRIEKIKDLDAGVLILGESGTGKSSVARLIHHLGVRRERPFVSVSCAAVPRDLLESELFGHERGAFTGAVSSRPGRIETADGGTLFLDEIGDMPLDLQPKLLTFLQDRVVQRVGSNHDIRVNARIIAATHRNLLQMCESGHFREDLYYRLNVFPLYLPPLRDRLGDIADLARKILQRIAASRGREPHRLSAEAEHGLLHYAWPGNVRELENVLERATAFAEGPEITLHDLSLPGASADSPLKMVALAGRSLEDIERQAIAETLELCKGNKAAAARSLGISEKSIYNKMSRLGMA